MQKVVKVSLVVQALIRPKYEDRRKRETSVNWKRLKENADQIIEHFVTNQAIDEDGQGQLASFSFNLKSFITTEYKSHRAKTLERIIGNFPDNVQVVFDRPRERYEAKYELMPKTKAEVDLFLKYYISLAEVVDNPAYKGLPMVDSTRVGLESVLALFKKTLGLDDSAKKNLDLYIAQKKKNDSFLFGFSTEQLYEHGSQKVYLTEQQRLSRKEREKLVKKHAESFIGGGPLLDQDLGEGLEYEVEGSIPSSLQKEIDPKKRVLNAFMSRDVYMQEEVDATTRPEKIKSKYTLVRGGAHNQLYVHSSDGAITKTYHAAKDELFYIESGNARIDLVLDEIKKISGQIEGFAIAIIDKVNNEIGIITSEEIERNEKNKYYFVPLNERQKDEIYVYNEAAAEALLRTYQLKRHEKKLGPIANDSKEKREIHSLIDSHKSVLEQAYAAFMNPLLHRVETLEYSGDLQPVIAELSRLMKGDDPFPWFKSLDKQAAYQSEIKRVMEEGDPGRYAKMPGAKGAKAGEDVLALSERLETFYRKLKEASEGRREYDGERAVAAEPGPPALAPLTGLALLRRRGHKIERKPDIVHEIALGGYFEPAVEKCLTLFDLVKSRMGAIDSTGIDSTGIDSTGIDSTGIDLTGIDLEYYRYIEQQLATLEAIINGSTRQDSAQIVWPAGLDNTWDRKGLRTIVPVDQFWKMNDDETDQLRIQLQTIATRVTTGLEKGILPKLEQIEDALGLRDECKGGRDGDDTFSI
jgi:hypothetical protein